MRSTRVRSLTSADVRTSPIALPCPLGAKCESAPAVLPIFSLKSAEHLIYDAYSRGASQGFYPSLCACALKAVFCNHRAAGACMHQTNGAAFFNQIQR